MAEVIDLGAPQRAMYMAMFNRMREGNDDQVSREIDRQAELDLRERQAAAGEARDRERLKMEQQEHARKMDEFNQTFGLRQQEADYNEWKAKDESTQNWIRTQAAQNNSNAEVLWRKAQTDKEKVDADRDRQDTEAKKWWLDNKKNEAIVGDARRLLNGYYARAGQGEQFGKDDADRVERATQIYYGDTNMRVPRGPAGEWLPDRDKIRGLQLTKDGTVSAQLGQQLHSADRPYDKVGQALWDLDHADPNLPQEQKDMLAQNAKNELYKGMPDPMKRFLNGILDATSNDPHAFYDALAHINAAKASGKANANLKIPTSKDVNDITDGMLQATHMRDLADQIPSIYDKYGYLPAGWGARTAAEWLNKVGLQDPEVTNWKKELDQVVLQNIFHYTGKRWNPNEADLARKGFPNPMEDPPEVLRSSLYRFADLVEEKLAMQMGYMKSFGYKTPDDIPDPKDPSKTISIPVIMPQEVFQALGENPAYHGDTGDLNADYTKELGVRAFRLSRLQEAARKRAGLDIGGTGSFRPTPSPGPTPLQRGPAQTSEAQKAAPPATFTNKQAFDFYQKHINKNATLNEGTD